MYKMTLEKRHELYRLQLELTGFTKAKRQLMQVAEQLQKTLHTKNIDWTLQCSINELDKECRRRASRILRIELLGK